MTSTRAFAPWDLRQQRVTSFAYTEARLRELISEMASEATNSPLSSVGRTIVIAAPITVTKKITIPQGCPGLTITAASKFPITPGGVIDVLFDVQAELVTIRDLFVYGRASPVAYFTTFVSATQPPSSGRSCTLLSVLDNDCFTDRVFVDNTTGHADKVIIRGNRQIEANATHGISILINSGLARIVDNILEDPGAGNPAIKIDAAGGQATIRGNAMNGGPITTVANSGHTGVVGNTNCGTITLGNVSDGQTGNT